MMKMYLTRPARAFLFALVALMPQIGAAQTPDDLFADDQMQEVRLTVNSKDWASLKEHADENTYYPADLRWQNVTVRNVGIRSRGRSTRNAVKPGLRLDFNRYASGQQFLGLKSLVLDNSYGDPSMAHETVTMKMFARMGMAAPREAHTRLYVNNTFVGVYVIVEQLDRAFVSRLYGSDEGSADNTMMYEYVPARPYQFDYLGPDLDTYAPLYEPKIDKSESAVALYDPIEKLIRTVNEAPDGQFEPQTSQYLDLVQAMKYIAVENFMAEVDGFVGTWTMNNYYLYRFRSGVAQLIPWDKDRTFASLTHPVDFNLQTNVLTIRAMNFPDLRQMYYDTIAECAAIAQEVVPDSGDSRGWLEREVDRQLRKIEPDLQNDPVFPFSMHDFHVEADGMLQFGQQRATFAGCSIAARARGQTDDSACAAALAPPAATEDGAN